jgi:hypothetical protein
MKYKVTIQGYGAEITAGSLTQEEAELVCREDKDIYDTIMDDFEDKSWYDINDQLHHWGASTENCTILIEDENGKEVAKFDSETGFYLEELDLEIAEYEYPEIDETKSILMCVSTEKGSFFEGDFEADEFDVNKFKIQAASEIMLGDFFWGDMITGVTYDGESVENYGGDTSGKSFDTYINFDTSTLRDGKIDQII